MPHLKIYTRSSVLGERKKGFSYSSVLLLLWSIMLSWKCFSSGIEFPPVIMVCNTVLTVLSKTDEGRLILPMLFVSEGCYAQLSGFRHTDDFFYGSTIFSFYLLFLDFRIRRCRHAVWVPIYSIALVINSFLSIFTKFVVLYAIVSHICFLLLFSHLSTSECSIVSTLIGYCITDFLMSATAIQNPPSAIPNMDAETSEYLAAQVAFFCSFSFLFIYYVLTCVIYNHVEVIWKFKRVSCSAVSSFLFFFSLFGTVTLFHFICCTYIHENAVLWIVSNILHDSYRLCTILGWAAGIPLATVLIDWGSQHWRTTAKRKMFHFLALVAFTAPAIKIPSFLALSISIAIGLLLVIEAGRLHFVFGFSVFSRFMAAHIDSRETTNGIIRSHIYLLYGLGMPIFFCHRYLPPFPPPMVKLLAVVAPGITGLGVVDAAAAIFGSKWGNTKMSVFFINEVFPPNQNTALLHKTVLGSICGFLCGVLFLVFLAVNCVGALNGLSLVVILLLVTCISLFESIMDGIDNLQLPLLVLGSLYSILCFCTL